jgi:type I restriction enzyme R subunit
VVGDLVEYDGPLDVDRIADDVVARIKSDADFAARIATELGRGGIND